MPQRASHEDHSTAASLLLRFRVFDWRRSGRRECVQHAIDHTTGYYSNFWCVRASLVVLTGICITFRLLFFPFSRLERDQRPTDCSNNGNASSDERVGTCWGNWWHVQWKIFWFVEMMFFEWIRSLLLARSEVVAVRTKRRSVKSFGINLPFHHGLTSRTNIRFDYLFKANRHFISRRAVEEREPPYAGS